MSKAWEKECSRESCLWRDIAAEKRDVQWWCEMRDEVSGRKRLMVKLEKVRSYRTLQGCMSEVCNLFPNGEQPVEGSCTMWHDLISMSRGSLRALWGKWVGAGKEQKQGNSNGTASVLQAKGDVNLCSQGRRRKWREAGTIEIFWNCTEQDSLRD